VPLPFGKKSNRLDRDFSFWITEGIGPTGVSIHFWPEKQIMSGSCHKNFGSDDKNMPFCM
jgi:hypothetical protein